MKPDKHTLDWHTCEMKAHRSMKTSKDYPYGLGKEWR
jgi:hypothetical protein